MFFVYILRSQKTGRFYVGHTDNLDDRLARHNEGRSLATRLGRPWNLVHTEEFPTRSQAMKREREIKSWKSHRLIERLIAARSGGVES